MGKVDLHIHTNKSDGNCSVEEIINKARDVGLQAIAITDHDTVEAIPLALEIVKQYNDLEIIPGIELSAEAEGKEFHMLGYFIDFEKKRS